MARLMEIHNAQTVCNCDDEAGITCEFCEATARNFSSEVARLVSEGQIRCLEQVARELCHGSQQTGCTANEHYEPFCAAAKVHARIAALKQQEG